MRLVSVFITGYGKFRNESFDFDKGYNVIIEDNGWGKSTLCAFIKAMFFGMNASRGNQLNDRKHYMPWDKGSYGGNLTFEIEDKKYRIERFFGSKESEDEFKLIDLETGKESDDFTSNIGEEIFEVDRDSFEKTVFVPQNALNTTMTDSINGKMGDLATVRDDVVNFENAIKKIENEIDIYKKNSRTDKRGKILCIDDEIRTLNEDVEKISSYKESLDKNTELLERSESEYNELLKEKEYYQNKIVEQSEKEQSVGEYKKIKSDLETIKKEIEDLDDFFANGIPENDELDEYIEVERNLELSKKETNKIQEEMPGDEEISRLKELFDEILLDEKIESWKEKATKLKELRITKQHATMSDEDRDKLQELKYYFNKKRPTNEEIEIIQIEAENVNRLQGRLVELKENYEEQKKRYEESENHYKNRASSNKSVKLLLVLVGIILLFGGVSLIVAVPSISGIISGVICIAIAIVILIFAFVVRSKKQKNEKAGISVLENELNDAEIKYNQVKNEYETSEKVCDDFLSDFLVNANDTKIQMVMNIKLKSMEYEKLLSDEEKAIAAGGNAVEELSELEVNLYTELARYQIIYGMDDLYTHNNEEELLYRLEEDTRVYKKYLEDDEKRQKLIENQDRMFKSVASFINRFPTLPQETIHEKLTAIGTKIDDYNKASNRLDDAIRLIKEFEGKNEVSEETVSVEELQNHLNEIDEKLLEKNNAKMMIRNQIKDARQNIEECEDKNTTIQELQYEKKIYLKKVEVLEATISYLTKAKENFISKYMGPLRKGMQGYLSRIDSKGAKIDSDKFRIDTSLSISINHDGSTKKADYLSCGYKDLASLCARFALVDIMYGDKKPMIVLDDPFTNLDENKIEMATNLIKEIAIDNQIIYLTCHNSRI